MPNIKNHIVILGAGYAGLLTALGLEKQGIPSLEITLIDRHDYQLLNFDLYEVATAEEEFVSTEKLKQAITFPLNKILKGRRINFIQAEFRDIDLSGKTINLGNKTISFDYLVMAAGSVSDNYGLKGSEFALPLKNLEDALRLRNRIEFSFQARSMEMTRRNLQFIVAGGGYTGCELAGELVELKNILCWKYNHPPEKVEILLIEATNALIPGFSRRLSADAYQRLHELGINILLSSPIVQMTAQYVELANGERLVYDAVAWTVGVKGKAVNAAPGLEVDRKGRIAVNELLQVKDRTAGGYYHNIFALGDVAAVSDKNGRPVPCSAQDAIDQAMYLSKALPQIIQNKKPAAYSPHPHGFIVSLGGKWAIMDYNGIYLKGLLAYFVRALAHVRYAAKIIGWPKAFLFVFFQVGIFGRND